MSSSNESTPASPITPTMLTSLYSIAAESRVVIKILGRRFHVLNTTDLEYQSLQFLVITIQVVGYNRATILKTIIVPSSCPVSFQHLSRNNQEIGEPIPLERFITSQNN